MQEVGPSWRSESSLANAVLLGLGVFLALVPFVIEGEQGANAWVDVAAGAAVAALALLRMLVWPSAAWIGALTGLIGAGMAIAALPLHERPGQGATALVVGVLIALVSIWSLTAPARRGEVV